MTRSFLTTFLLIAIVGLVASFLNPAVPHQVDVKPTTSTFGATKLNMAFVDAGLDNPSIEADNDIQAARKCGFCMG